MAQQTAVDWYYEQTVIEGKTNYYELLEQAKQMEKEQMEKAYKDYPQTISINDNGDYKLLSAEEYYNENYGTQLQNETN